MIIVAALMMLIPLCAIAQYLYEIRLELWKLNQKEFHKQR